MAYAEHGPGDGTFVITFRGVRLRAKVQDGGLVIDGQDDTDPGRPDGREGGRRASGRERISLEGTTAPGGDRDAYRPVPRRDEAGNGPFQERTAGEIAETEEITDAPLFGSFTAPESFSAGVDFHSMSPETLEFIDRLGRAAAGAARQALAERSRSEGLESAARAWNVLVSADGDHSVREAAHILNRDPAISTGQRRLFAFIRDSGMVSPGTDVPLTRHERHLRLRPTSYAHPRTGRRVSARPQLRVTTEGLRYLHRRLSGAVPLAVDAAA